MAECETLDAFCAAGEFLRRLCPVHQVKAEPAPVLVTGRRVAEAVLVNPFEQPARTRAEHGAEKKSDVHMAILARKDKAQPQVPLLHSSSDAFRRMVVPARGQQVEGGGHHHRGLRRDIDVLADPIAFSSSQSY